jgi:hypothetical protein
MESPKIVPDDTVDDRQFGHKPISSGQGQREGRPLIKRMQPSHIHNHNTGLYQAEFDGRRHGCGAPPQADSSASLLAVSLRHSHQIPPIKIK